MPLIQCIDCGKSRRHKRRGAKAKRCRKCAKIRGRKQTAARTHALKIAGRCIKCGAKRSNLSASFCPKHRRRHAELMLGQMRQKRAKSPAYRKDEREKVRARMRAIRAERRKLGVNNDGAPYKSEVWKRRISAS
jgi:hypothetical protein